MPCFSFGKLSSKIACEIGWSAPPPAPWSARAARMNPSDGAIPQRNDATVKMMTEVVR